MLYSGSIHISKANAVRDSQNDIIKVYDACPHRKVCEALKLYRNKGYFAGHGVFGSEVKHLLLVAIVASRRSYVALSRQA